MSLRKRWKERREAYEHSVAEIEQSKKQKLHNSRLVDSVDVKNQHKEDSGGVSEQIDDDYSTLQQSLLNEVMQPGSNKYSSLLLPPFVQKCGSVKVFVEGTNNLVLSTASRMTVEHYISQLSNERNAALEEARSYRNQVDELRTKNRKLHCEMNDRVDVIRNFWRNSIAEGSTRAGLCVLSAQKNKKYNNSI